MKKKFKFLSILSSIFGVGSICGLFALSSIRSDKQIEETRAENVVLLYQGGILKTFYNGNDSYNFVGNYKYYSITGSSGALYQFEVNLTCTFYVETGINTFEYIYFNPLIDNPSFSSSLNFRSSLFNTSTDYFDLYLEGVGVNEDVDRAIFGFKFPDVSENIVFIECFSNNYRYLENYIDFAEDIVSENYVLSDVNLYDVGYGDGYQQGYNQGYDIGNTTGYNQGYNNGFQDGKYEQSQIDESLISSSYSDGYSAGYSAAVDQDSVTTSVINGILQVGFVPVNFFLSILNFEVLGINLKGLITGILTIALVLIVWRMIVSGKTGGD